MYSLQDIDPQVFAAIQNEIQRQNNKLELIASENFVSQAVLQAMGQVMTNKYAEGYPASFRIPGEHGRIFQFFIGRR